MAADTFSSTLGYLIMGTGNDNNSWGSNANAEVFQVFEDAIANALTSTVTGGTLDLSGSPPPASASQVRHAALIFNGTLLSGQVVKVPNLTKFWWVQNATSGAFALTIQTPSGSASPAIPQNSGWQLVQCDGANNITVSPFNSKQIQLPDGSAAAPPFSSINETNSGWRRAGTQDWRLTINGADVLQVTGPGAATPNVVNVLSPAALQIAGVQPVPSGTVVAFDGIAPPTGWIFVTGQALSRPIANGGSVDTYKGVFNAITVTVVGNTNGNTSITGLASDMRGQGLNRAFVEGTGIAGGTTITFTGATTATLSAPATGSHPGTTLRILPFGQGDASSTFNVRDGRDLALFGRGDMATGGPGPDRALITLAGGTFDGTLLGTSRVAGDIPGGAQNQTLGATQIPPHTHSGTTGTESVKHTHSVPAGASGFVGFAGGAGGVIGTSSGQTTGVDSVDHTHAFTTDNGTGGGLSHPNMPPSGITNMIMKL